MKKILVISGSILLLFILLLFLLPAFLRNNITGIIERQTAKHINAELHIETMQLSMFKSFPDLNVSIRNITLSGKKEFSGDTLLYVPLFNASVNVLSLLRGNEIIINRILLKDSRFNPHISETGSRNWDIFFHDSLPSSPAKKDAGISEKKDAEELRLNDIRIDNLSVDYQDASKQTYARIDRLNLSLSGNFAAKHTLLKTELSAKDISFRQGNILWINHTDFNWQSNISANFQEQLFEIEKNSLSINELQLALNGKIGIKKEKYNLDLQLKAPDSRFENLLTLIPKELRKQFDGIQTAGKFTLDIITQGCYYTDHLPYFQAELAVQDASLKYPELPESIKQINMDLKIGNPGGPIDSTRINLQQLTFNIAGNPFSMNLLLVNPNDPSLHGSAKGAICFSNLKRAIPLKDINIEGNLYTDLLFSGKYTYIEKKEYEKFKATGEIKLNQIMIKTTDFPEGISIPSGELIVTPSMLKINKIEAKTHSSDFTVTGSISNYLPYLLKNQPLKGDLSLNSQLLNLNELMSTCKPASIPLGTTSIPDTSTIRPLPENLDLHLRTNIKKLLFDRLTVHNLQGNFGLENATVSFSEVYMELLQGTLRTSGIYDTKQSGGPRFNIKLNISDADIHSAWESFSFIRQNIPIAMNCEGKVSADCKLAAALTPTGSLNLKTANGNGFITSRNILINRNPTLEKLASILKNEELNRISISALKIEFEMQQGDLTIKPFQTTLAGNPATIYGKQSAEGDIDYTIALNVKRKYFGKDIENILKSIPGTHNIESLNLDVNIEGTSEKPKVKPDLSKALKTIRKEAEKELKKKTPKGLMKELNKLFR